MPDLIRHPWLARHWIPGQARDDNYGARDDNYGARDDNYGARDDNYGARDDNSFFPGGRAASMR